MGVLLILKIEYITKFKKYKYIYSQFSLFRALLPVRNWIHFFQKIMLLNKIDK